MTETHPLPILTYQQALDTCMKQTEPFPKQNQEVILFPSKFRNMTEPPVILGVHNDGETGL